MRAKLSRSVQALSLPGRSQVSTKAQSMLAFKQSLVFYTTFHSNPINQLIHFVFVPAILWSALVCLAYCPTFSISQMLPVLGDHVRCAHT